MKIQLANQGHANNQAVQTKSETATETAQFFDQRQKTESVATGELMHGSPRTMQLQAIADSIHNSPRVTQMKALAESMQHNPRMAAQRRQMHGIVGLSASVETSGPRQETEEDPALQVKPDSPAPLQLTAEPSAPESGGLPHQLKSWIESLSGMSMNHVKVHYNSSQPAQLNALAYAQGGDIHIAPGQERHLPHEAWHVVQQAQGRVRQTMQMKLGVPVNDDPALEREADVMGTRALAEAPAQLPVLKTGGLPPLQQKTQSTEHSNPSNGQAIQRISAGDARVRLGIEADDDSAAAAVEIIQLVHQIIDEIPALEAALATYQAFLNSHAGRIGMAAKKSDLHRWMGGSVKFISDKLAPYIEILEGLEDWYTEAEPSVRNASANENIALWRTEGAAFHDLIAPIATLMAEQSGPLYEFSGTLINGLGALGRLKKLLGDWLSGGGGFSALGRAHDIAAKVVVKGTLPEDGTLVKDNHVLENHLLGQGQTKNAAHNRDVYKANVVEATDGPLIVAGRPRTTAEAENRPAILADAEAGMNDVQTSEDGVYAATPGSRDRGKGQHFNMNNTNARGYSWLLNMPGWNSSKWEWLHVKAASLGGATDSTNLILGTRDANTQMMPFESNVRTLASLIHKHPDLKNLTVGWRAHYKHPLDAAKHAYEFISIFWVVNPQDHASTDLKKKAAAAGGKAIFDVLHTESMLSKSEVQHLEDTLSTFRETLQPEE
jgi:hypothetical protein